MGHFARTQTLLYPPISKNNNITHDQYLSPGEKPLINLTKKFWPFNFEITKSFPPIVTLEKRVYIEKRTQIKFIHFTSLLRCNLLIHHVGQLFFFFQGQFTGPTVESVG